MQKQFEDKIIKTRKLTGSKKERMRKATERKGERMKEPGLDRDKE